MGKSLFYIFITLLLFCCNSKKDTTEFVSSEAIFETNHLDIGPRNVSYSRLLKVLEQIQSQSEFELDTTIGYIKTGDFWNDGNKYAVIFDFENRGNFYIRQFNNNKWVEIYSHDSLDLWRAFPIIPEFQDYNFDGITDIAFHVCSSNGLGIKSYRLWLKTPDTFHYVSNFGSIGTPKIYRNEEKIRSYSGCCCYQELEIKEYKWDNYNLVLTDCTDIINTSFAVSTDVYKRINEKMELISTEDYVDRDIARKLVWEFENRIQTQ